MLKNKLSKRIGLLALFSALILLALTSLFILGRDANVSAAQQGTIVTLVPPEQAYAGELITIKLVVNNAHNLAGYQGTVGYDANNLRLVGAVTAEGLSLGGRDIQPLEAIRREGTVILGAATCPVSNCSDSQYNSAPRYAQGVDGYVELAGLEFIAQAPGRYELALENMQLVDPEGNQLGTAVVNIILEVNTR